jgi:hypothetical protein
MNANLVWTELSIGHVCTLFVGIVVMQAVE